MTRLMAYEIHSNPKDLHCVTYEAEGGHHFAISRGPGHNYKPLITTITGFASREEAVAVIGEELTMAREVAKRELGGGGLTEEEVARIVADLLAHGTASTF